MNLAENPPKAERRFRLGHCEASFSDKHLKPGPEYEKARVEWIQAYEDFAANPLQTKGWAKLQQVRLGRYENPRFLRRKRGFFLISSIGIAAGLFGIIPSEIGVIGLKFSNSEKIAYLIILILASIYSRISYAIELRQFLVEEKLIEIELRAEGSYKSFFNRATQFIDANEFEIWTYYFRFSSVITIIVCIGLIYRIFTIN